MRDRIHCTVERCHVAFFCKLTRNLVVSALPSVGRSPMSVVGLIGLGAVGSSLAMLLAENGYRVFVADARPRSHFDALLRERVPSFDPVDK